MIKFDANIIEDIIGYKFQDQRILMEAFTHSSYANENADSSYERLEFLGDSILGMVVSQYLFNRYPDEDEGFLTKAKASIVSGRTLSKAIDRMGLIKYVRTASGSIEEEIKRSNNVKEDIFEAIIGAIIQDSGKFEVAEGFIYSKLGNEMSADFKKVSVTDFKSRLLELCAQKGGVDVTFDVVPLADNVNSGFMATILLNGKKYGSGKALSKKKAEQQAAKQTLEMLKI
ncbi:MAG: ribonuclease III [Clostridia bacterium]|nr:ribonuclease III [Clostridia bacterium]